MSPPKAVADDRRRRTVSMQDIVHLLPVMDQRAVVDQAEVPLMKNCPWDSHRPLHHPRAVEVLPVSQVITLHRALRSRQGRVAIRRPPTPPQ